MPTTQERIAADTVTFSDEFSSYRFMKRTSYNHRTVNHSKEEYARFDPVDGVVVHTNTIGSFWAHFKIALRVRRGTRRCNLETFARIRSWRTLKESIFGLLAALSDE
jgi:hypothetical protein